MNSSKKVKQKKCAWKECGEKFTPFNSFQKTCHNAKCANGFVQQEKAKEEKKRKQKIRKDLVEYREKNKPLSKHISEAEKEVNLYVRIRDYFDPCITCGKPRHEIEQEQGWKPGGC